MRWILDDIRSAMDALRRTRTWLVIAMVFGFFLLAFATFKFAMRSDAILMSLKFAATSCREMSNASIILLFCGMIFFLFSATVALGEVHQYYYFKQLSSHRQAAQSKKHGIGWVIFALSIAISGLTFFNLNCI